MAFTSIDLSYMVGQLAREASPAAGNITVRNTNVDVDVASFPADIDTYRTGMLTCPTDATGTVTFRATGRRESGTGAANIVIGIDTRAIADSEAIEGAWTADNAAAAAVDTTLGDLDQITWTETVTNLAWTAGDLILFRVSRRGSDAGDTLTVPWYWYTFTMEIPHT